MTRGRKLPWGITLGDQPAPGKKKPRYNRGESVTGANDAPGWGYRARSPAQGGRAGTFMTNVPDTTTHPPRSSTPEVPQPSGRAHGTATTCSTRGRKLVPGRARRALCNKSHKEQYVTNCIINTPRVGYFLTGVTVPQAASGFWGVCPHLIHRDIHRICGRLGRARNDGALSRSVESLRKFVSASYAPLCVSFPALPTWRARTVLPRVPVTQVWDAPSGDQPQGISAGRVPPAAAPLPSPASR